MRNAMSNKKPLNLTLEPEILVWLDQIMKERHYTSRSVLVEELIRERYDQVFGKSVGPTQKSSNSPYQISRMNEADQMHEKPAAPPPPKKKRAA